MNILTLYSLCATCLVLQFDGSLRRPADPHKEIIPTSLSSKLSPFAVCSFALLQDDSNSETGKIIALGSKEIPNYGTTSADVEYEGLILGLKSLLHVYEHCEEYEYVPLRSPLLVRGDCKTVIDQMNGVSLSRKLRSYYNEATLIREQLEQNHDVHIHFEHVTRDHNELCDGMCKVIMQRLQENVVSTFLSSLKSLEENFVEIPLPRNRKKRLKFEKTPFLEALNVISNWNGYVPLSLRPYLLCEMYYAADRSKDFVAMRLVGDVMRNEAKQWKKQNISIDVSTLHEIELVGWHLTYKSLKSMGLEKEAESIVLQNNQVRHMEEEVVHILQEQMPWLKPAADCVKSPWENVAARNVDDQKKLNQWHEDVVINAKFSSEEPWVIFK